MREQNVPGLSVAVVDDQGIVWTEGFGVTERHGSQPVTADTAFSIQSISKTFTATAVLSAVQDGLLDLDEPLTTYLPNFTVHSVFEAQPESKITLRTLLSHTAGFTHEAPVGNNFDVDAESFEAHIGSISDTWLRFPVGTGYGYSNAGVDLAGYVLQEVTRERFADAVRHRVLEPLGMANSSFDAAVIGANDDRAIGHVPPYPRVFVPSPMVPAGGMYSSASDMARFVQFQLAPDAVDGRAVLDPAMLDEMRTVQFPGRNERYGYGLGVARDVWHRGGNADLFSHGGGGFGFLADLWWAPDLQLGIVVLTNSADHDLQVDLAIRILDDLVHAPGPYNDNLRDLPPSSAAQPDRDGWQDALAADIRSMARPADPDTWRRYLGDYKTPNWDVIAIDTSPSRVYEDDGTLYFDGDDIEASEGTDDPPYALHEVQPGLFFTETGEALDFRTDPPTFRNLQLQRVGTGPTWLVRAILAMCALAMLVALFTPLARRVRHRGRPRGAEALSPTHGHPANVAVSGFAVATSLCGLATIAALVIYPRLIYAGYLGWLDLAIFVRLWLHAPLGLFVGTVALAAMTVRGWQQGWWRPRQHRIHFALLAAALVEIVFLAAWGLIGIGSHSLL
jgi:CubicO group peptidase (beta-lactamase class C family)